MNQSGVVLRSLIDERDPEVSSRLCENAGSVEINRREKRINKIRDI